MNSGLGQFKDDPVLLMKAAEYLFGFDNVLGPVAEALEGGQ